MKINLNYKKTARIISMMCGLLFSIFSIVYLYVFQTDVLEAMHFSMAHGKTVFSPFASALTITLILLVLSVLLSRFFYIKGTWHSLAYIPAFIVLASFTDIHRGIYMSGYSSHNFWIYTSLFVLSILALYFSRSSFISTVKRGIVHPMIYNVNILCMILLSLGTMLMGMTDKLYHNELQVESCLRRGNNYEALMVSRRSPETTRTLTALRALALSKEGLMGEKIFEYPQCYGSKGLFFSSDSLTTLRYSNDSVSMFLKVDGLQLNEFGQLRELCLSDSCSTTVADYYLAGLLLDRRLDDFVSILPKYYAMDKDMPKHYKEALILHATVRHIKMPNLEDTALLNEYNIYLDDKRNCHSDQYESNLMKRKYGKTYWWYYDYQK